MNTKNYEYGYSISERQQFVGEFTGKRNEQGMAEVAVKNKFLLGDEVEMMTPQGNIVFKIEKCSIEKRKCGSRTWRWTLCLFRCATRRSNLIMHC